MLVPYVLMILVVICFTLNKVVREHIIACVYILKVRDLGVLYALFVT